MKLIGLTGGIATGKSTVTLYVQAQQVPVIDCDVLARNILQPGHPVYAQVAKHFPTCVSNTQGLDRKALGKLIFSSPSARKTLNQLTHGSIRRQLLVQVLCHWLKGTSLLLIDAPLLIEAGLDKWMSEVVVVYCPVQVYLFQRN
ncbi:hypothetical protein HMI56_004801 [Coelomomyces lativittatus]|nr:hypothetical protein HMI56_004801 [Coelomomyces lativittatus]